MNPVKLMKLLDPMNGDFLKNAMEKCKKSAVEKTMENVKNTSHTENFIAETAVDFFIADLANEFKDIL